MPPLATALERRLSPWGALVAVSAIIVVGGLATLAVWGLATRERRVSTYAIRGSLDEIELDLGAADAELVGGAHPGVRQTERYAFGHRAHVTRTVADGRVRIRSRCPTTVLHSCSASYRVTVPDNVSVVVRTGDGDVSLSAFRGQARIVSRSGDVDVRGFCGFLLQARAETGDVGADLACAPEDLTLRSSSGTVRAVVPPGRYRLDADTNTGRRTVRGLASDAGAPFSIQALSSSGDVIVEARR